MNKLSNACLLLTAVILAGMATPPEKPVEANILTQEDKAVIAQLDALEEQAMAEDLDFLMFLEMMAKTPSKEQENTHKEAE